MVTMQLKGLYWSARKRKDGSQTFYYYAWKGGPLIWKGDRKLASAPPELVAAFHEAHRAAKPNADGFVAGLVSQWRASPEWKKLAPRTQADYRRWVDEIVTAFGLMPIEALNDRNVRKHFIKWRNKWEDRPRQADYAIMVLAAMLSWAKAQSIIDHNRAQGVSKLYEVKKQARIWTTEEILSAEKHCSKEVFQAIRFISLTGLRLGDAVALRWDHVNLDHIERPTNKSRGKRSAYIPILPELRALMDTIPRRAVTVLTNTRQKPWAGGSGLSHAITDTARAIGIERDTHDLRKTFATRLAIAGLDDRTIAEILGWSLESVTELRRVYVDREALVVSISERLANKASNGSSNGSNN